MILRNGYVRLEGGVWVNMEQAKLMRIYFDAREQQHRIEIMAKDGEEWLCEEIFGSAEEATLALDQFFEKLG